MASAGVSAKTQRNAAIPGRLLRELAKKQQWLLRIFWAEISRGCGGQKWGRGFMARRPEAQPSPESVTAVGHLIRECPYVILNKKVCPEEREARQARGSHLL